MIKPIFSIRDVKTSFMSPFVDDSILSAQRGFEIAVKGCSREDSLIALAPDDFSLFHVADFDTLSGEIVPVSPIEFICAGSEV